MTFAHRTHGVYRSHHVSTDGEAVDAPIPIRALVARRELPAEHLVRKFLGLLRERWVGLARVDEQRRLGLLEIFLQNSKCSLISPRRS